MGRRGRQRCRFSATAARLITGSDVAIVVLTSPFLPASLRAVRVLRLPRLMRLLCAVGAAPRVFSLEGVRFVAVLAVLTALGGGASGEDG